jgi:hypothetical protein
MSYKEEVAFSCDIGGISVGQHCRSGQTSGHDAHPSLGLLAGIKCRSQYFGLHRSSAADRTNCMKAVILPLIDTVVRIQRAECDVIISGFTCSNTDQVLSEFFKQSQSLQCRHYPILQKV